MSSSPRGLDFFTGFRLDRTQLTFNALIGVTPIGVSDSFPKAEIWLQSIERYAAGFVAHMRLLLDIELPRPEPGDETPELPLEMQGSFVATSAVDDLGNSYVGHFRNAHGRGTPDGKMELGLVHSFFPGLHNSARRLTFTVHLLKSLQYTDEGQPDMESSQVLAGPWNISYPLTSDPSPDQQVIAVGQNVVRDDLDLTVYSIERSSDEFRVVARLDWTGMMNPMPRMAWSAIDDRGNVYRTSNCAGGGGSSVFDDESETHPHSWRMLCLFARPIDPLARQITLELEQVQFQQHYWENNNPANPTEWALDREANALGPIVVDLP